MSELKDRYLENIKHEYYSCPFDRDSFYFWVICVACGLATEPAYSDVERGRQLNAFFQALKEVLCWLDYSGT